MRSAPFFCIYVLYQHLVLIPCIRSLKQCGQRHQPAKAKLTTYGNNFPAKTVFFAQNVAQLRNFV